MAQETHLSDEGEAGAEVVQEAFLDGGVDWLESGLAERQIPSPTSSSCHEEAGDGTDSIPENSTLQASQADWLIGSQVAEESLDHDWEPALEPLDLGLDFLADEDVGPDDDMPVPGMEERALSVDVGQAAPDKAEVDVLLVTQASVPARPQRVVLEDLHNLRVPGLSWQTWRTIGDLLAERNLNDKAAAQGGGALQAELIEEDGPPLSSSWIRDRWKQLRSSGQPKLETMSTFQAQSSWPFAEVSHADRQQLWQGFSDLVSAEALHSKLAQLEGGDGRALPLTFSSDVLLPPPPDFDPPTFPGR